MKKTKFIIMIYIFVALLLPFGTNGAKAMEQIDVNAKAALLADYETGEIYYEKNIHDRVYPASTTKIMTALLVFEACERGEVSIEDMVTASDTFQEDLAWDGSSENIQPGEIMSLENLLYCLMVSSANEACNIVAEYIIGGSISDFIELMNVKADELGCSDTNFANTHGLPDANHYTTAYDMFLITCEALKHPGFVRMSNTTKWEVPATNLSDKRILSTTNSLIRPDMEKYYYKYAGGIKTGSTNDAGFCLVSSAEKDGMSPVSVILGAQAVKQEDESYEIQSFSETKRLFEWFFDNFSYRDILTSTDLVGQANVEWGDGMDSVVVHSNKSLSLILPNEVQPDDFQRDIVIYSELENADPLQAPIYIGQVLGEMKLTYLDKTYGPFPLVANTDVPLSKYEYMKAKISDTLSHPLIRLIIAVGVLIIVLYIFLVVRYNLIRSKQRKAEKENESQAVISGKRR